MSEGEADPNINPTEAGMIDETTETEKNAEPDMPEKAGAERAGKRPTGYKNPPEHTRFKPGQSGNPKGRPKGSKNLMNIVEMVGKEKMVIRENGRRRTIEAKEAVIRTLLIKALDRDPRAIDGILKLFFEQEAQADARTAARSLTGDERAILEDLLKEISGAQEGEGATAEKDGDLSEKEAADDRHPL